MARVKGALNARKKHKKVLSWLEATVVPDPNSTE